MRCFFALPLPESARAGLVASCSGLRTRVHGRGARWVPEENLHLTLRFLGDADAAQRNAVTRLAGDVIRMWTAPKLELGEAGIFPPKGKRDLIFWVGLAGELPALAELAREFESCAREAGFRPERRAFKPHVTLARLRGEPAQALSSQLLPSFPTLDCTPDSVVLYQSVFDAGGVRYATLESWPFNRP